VRTISTDQVVRQLAFESLLSVDEQGNTQARLVEKWTTAADGKGYTFTLRKGVKFHNGQEMTADDVKFSMDYTMNPANGAFGFERLRIVESVDVVDPSTLQIALKDTSSAFLPALGGIESFGVIPKDSLETGVDRPSVMPAGTGPFKFVSWQPRQQLVFERFPDYWGQTANVDRIVLKPIEDATVRMTALRSGDVDVIERTPYEWVQQIKDGRLQGIGLTEAKTAGYRRIVFNSADPPFDNPKLRQAVMHAIDMKEVLQAGFFGFGELADQKYPAGHKWYIQGVPAYQFDPDRAKAMLAEAGYNGETITMHVENAADVQTVAATIQAQLKKVGVNLAIQPLEFASQRDLIAKGQFTFDFMGSNYYDDPFSTYNDLICENPRNRIVNYAGYCDQEMDSLLRQIEKELDPTKQQALLKQVLTKRYNDLPQGMGIFVPRFYAFRDVLKNFVTDDDQNLVWSKGGLQYAWLESQP
jgi:peptide/nickel transport system substrate-binding protein